MAALFPKWMNALPTVAALGSVGALSVAVGGVWYWATPEFWEVGYMPAQPALTARQLKELKTPADPNEQPKPIAGVDYPGFSHQIHAGKLGIDCRYCHTKVEVSSEANIPNVSTCFGCHAESHVSREIARDTHTEFVRAAYKATTNDAGEAIEGGASIPWKRVHKLPDYVRNFPHNVHVRAGVSCFYCHGQIMGMPVVHQEHSLSMSWCLDCHRTLKDNPHQGLVPPDRVTRLVWVEQSWSKDPQAPALARQVYDSLKLAPPENCGACHY